MSAPGPREARWPDGHPRILLADAWLANAGDAAIAVALDRVVREIAPGAAVLHAAYQWDTVGPLVPDLTFVPPLEDLLGTPWAPPAPRWEIAGAALVEQSDLVICQGGGYLVEAYQPLARLAALAKVLAAGKRLALVGISMGSFRDAEHLRYLRAILRGAELVVVRDEASLAHAREAGAREPVIGTDLALGLFADTLATPVSTGTRHGVSVVVTDHHPIHAARIEQAAVADAVLRAAIESAGEEPITVWSTVQGDARAAREDDLELARRLVARLPAPAQRAIAIVEGLVTPDRAIDLVRGSRALVTMRMHPALFAAATGTPFALVLGDDRSGLFAETPFEACIAAPNDPLAVDAVIRAAVDGSTNGARTVERVPSEALAPLCTRFDVMTDRLSTLLAGPPEDRSRRASLATRTRNTLKRSARHLGRAGRSVRDALPRRSVGAVQGPVRTGIGPRSVWGWTYAGDDEVVTVVVTVDGRPVGSASLGPVPADVVSAIPASIGVGGVGWTATVELNDAPRTVELGALAITGAGRIHTLTPLRVSVEPEPVGSITGPPDDSVVVPGPLAVVGWVSPDMPLARIEVAVDGQPADRARPFAHDGAAPPLSGFEHVVVVGSDAVGRRLGIVADAVALDGTRRRIGTIGVDVGTAPAPSVAHVDELARRSSVEGPAHRRLRLAVFTHTLSLGGAQRWLYEVLRCALMEHGHECLVIAGNDGPLRAEIEALGGQVQVTPLVLDYPPSEHAGPALAAIASTVDPDVVLVNTVVAAGGASAAQRLGCPFIWAVHEHLAPNQVRMTHAGQSDPEATALLVDQLRRAARVVFVCEATRALYANFLGSPLSDCVVEYGIDLDAFGDGLTTRPVVRGALEDTHAIPADASLLVSLASVEPRKGAALVVRALAALGEDVGDIHYALVGAGDAHYTATLREFTRRSGMEGRVHLIPATSDPSPWLAAADLFVMPSDLESMPRAAMEAMAARLPVLLADVAGCSELLDDGRAGILVPTRDVAGLVAGVRRWLAMPPATRTALGEAARTRLAGRHGDLSYATRILELLEDAVGARRHAGAFLR